MLGWLALALVVAAVAGLAWVRLAPHDPARWHVHPKGVAVAERNMHWQTQRFDGLSVEAAREAVRAVAGARGAEPLAEDDDLLTYVERTPLVGYPDYVTATLEPVEGGTLVGLLSRSRFGYSDLGANEARVAEWHRALAAAVDAR